MTAPRKNIMLGTAGHVDHGKTALVKLLTGCDTDTLAAEKQRGLTIELGFAPCQMADERILGIVDVPGHVDFIRNMAAGAHGVDVVILVVAADDGVMPQTREHLDILTLMGVRHGLVALTKIDLVDAEMRRLAADDVREFVRGTFLDGAPVCPISNVTGEGFDGFFAAMNAAADAAEPHEVTGLFRQWVERSFLVRGFGTVVSGIPTSGRVRVGDRLSLLPGGQVGRVRGMEVYGQLADVGRAGECVALNLADVDVEHLTRGTVLCAGECFEPVTMAEANLRLLDSVPQPLKDYTEAHLHVGAGEVMAHLALLEGDRIAPGTRGLVQLRLREPLGLAIGERFVLRASLPGLAGGRVTTIGGGRILDTTNLRLRRKRPWTLQRLGARRDAIDSPRDFCAQVLAESDTPLSPAQLAGRAQWPEDEARNRLEALHKDGAARKLPSGLYAAAGNVRAAAEAIREAIAEFHDANPSRLGAEGEAIRQRLGDRGPLFDAALEDLIEAGTVQRHAAVLALAGRSAKISPADRDLLDRVETLLRQGHLAPPGPEKLAKDLRQERPRIDEMIRLLIDSGAAVRLDAKVVLHRDAVEAARQVVLDLFKRSPSFETVQFRDALGVSRKFAVPLLDYFDTVRLTVRGGSRRTPGAEARRLAEPPAGADPA